MSHTTFELLSFLLLLASPTNALTTLIQQQQQKSLHLITFDLDDTLFPITPVLQDANHAMIQTLTSHGYTDASLQSYTSFSKQIRTELRETNEPITYTELRMRSIQKEMERCRRTLLLHPRNVHDDDIIQRAFDAWVNERNASAERHLFPDTIQILERLRDQYPDVVIGAVTNGRGNPFRMEQTLKDHFHFCVCGDDDGVFPYRKPHEEIFRIAVEDRANRKLYDDELGWIHVGDDLANDVGASAKCGAMAIWFDLKGEEESLEKENTMPSWSTASKEELEERRKLADRAMMHVSKKISTLAELPDAIDELLLEE